MITRLPFHIAQELTRNTVSVFRDEVAEDQGNHHWSSTYKDAEICLNCTKEKCGGGEDCFAKAKREWKAKAGKHEDAEVG